MHEMSSVKQKIQMSAFECFNSFGTSLLKTESFVGLVEHQFSLV